MAHINAKTILESLTEPNPFLHEQQPKSKSNTSSEDFLDLDITEVEEWQDFTYENLFAAFSDILLENTKYQDNWPGDNTRPNPRDGSGGPTRGPTGRESRVTACHSKMYGIL